MRIIIILACGLFLNGQVQDKIGLPTDLSAIAILAPGEALAQVGSSISADGSAPNNNAMLDVQSPASGDGKGMLIPRVTSNQRTNANASLAGGLLDNSGNLRGGAAQGLIVYQTDGVQGLYFNTSQSSTPAWAYLGDVSGFLASNAWTSAGSTTNYLPRTGGTMSGALNMGTQIITNAAHVDFSADTVSVGRGANGITEGTALGFEANGFTQGSAVGKSANGSSYGTALGFGAQGTNFGVALGRLANGSGYGQAVGFQANGSEYGAAVGRQANGYNYGVAVGFNANGSTEGVALGDVASGYNYGAAVGQLAKGTNYGAAVGASANGSGSGAAMGYQANGYSYGAVVGRAANGNLNGAVVGYQANGYYYAAAVGRQANGVNEGVAIGYLANGAEQGVAAGVDAEGGNFGAGLGYSARGTNYGAAVGSWANGETYGAAAGYAAEGFNSGAALGQSANGSDYGAAVGRLANGARTNVAIGAQANAQAGTQRIAIGYNVTNTLNNTAAVRGTLYLDGGTGINYRATFGSGAWANKAFEIDHPLDPENKILRHFCLEGPQVWNVYAGNVQLVNGQAKVQLPDYYSALNLVGSEIYSLTVVDESVDQFPLVKLVTKVANNCFVIAGTRDIKVSWTIKVLRNDPDCLEDLRRRPVEQMKKKDE